MTDPKSISRNREYYTDQYGNSRPTTRDNAVGGSYEASVDISDEFGSDISTDPNVPSEYQEFFSDAPGEQVPNDGQLMDGVNEQVNGSIPPGAQPIQWDASQIKEEIQDLLKDNKDLLENAEAYDQFNDQFKALERQIGKPGVDPESLMDQMLELKDDLSGAVEEVKSTNSGKFDAAIRDVQSMIDRVEDADLTDEKRTELTEQLQEKLDSLKEGKRKNELFGEQTEDEVKELREDVARAIGTGALIDDFEGLPAKIPNRGAAPQYTTNLVRAARDAMNNGNWSQFSSLLGEIETVASEDGLPASLANDIIQQFVGAIYFGVAGEDENKLDQFLSLIPREYRQRLADIATASSGELQSMGLCSTDAERRENYFYGNPQVTADRLLDDDIERAGERIGRSEPGSPDND